MALILHLRKDLTARILLKIRCFQQGDWSALSTAWDFMCMPVSVWGGLLGSRGFLPQSPLAETHWRDPSGEESYAGFDFGCRPGPELWSFAKVFCSGMSLDSLWEWVCIPTCTCLHSRTSSLYRQELPWAAFLKAQVLYYQVNFLSAWFAWSKSDILWPVRFMAAFSRALFSPPINTSGYKPSSDSLLFCLWFLSCFVRNKNRGILKHISVA